MRRILTAILLVLFFVGLVLWAPPYLLAVVGIGISEVGLWEFFRLAQASGFHALRAPGYAFAGIIAAVFLAEPGPVWLLAAVVLFLIVLLATALLSNVELSRFLGSVSSTLLGVLYVALPLNLLLWVCLQPNGRLLVLLGLVVVWTGDTMAFFVGRAWGKDKLSPHISPGKTWEGAVASLIFAVVAALLFSHFLLNEISLLRACILAVAINIAAQVGDLVESAMKRNAGVKDSSTLVPGHGGVLDRIDALLFAAPVLWYYWLWKGL